MIDKLLENSVNYVTEGVAEYILTLFPPTFTGVCIDVGAYHPFWISNSWLLERVGWDVHCIEPNPKCISLLKQHRKSVYQYACGGHNEDDAELFIYRSPIVGDAGGTGILRHSDWGSEQSFSHIDKTNIRSLNWLLENEIKVSSIDCLSIDTERSEMVVLSGIDLDFYKPKVIVIEDIDKEGVQKKYLEERGYTYNHRIIFNDFYLRNE